MFCQFRLAGEGGGKLREPRWRRRRHNKSSPHLHILRMRENEAHLTFPESIVYIGITARAEKENLPRETNASTKHMSRRDDAHAPIDVPEKVAPQALVKAMRNGVAATAIPKPPPTGGSALGRGQAAGVGVLETA